MRWVRLGGGGEEVYNTMLVKPSIGQRKEVGGRQLAVPDNFLWDTAEDWRQKEHS